MIFRKDIHDPVLILKEYQKHFLLGRKLDHYQWIKDVRGWNYEHFCLKRKNTWNWIFRINGAKFKLQVTPGSNLLWGRSPECRGSKKRIFQYAAKELAKEETQLFVEEEEAHVGVYKQWPYFWEKMVLRCRSCLWYVCWIYYDLPWLNFPFYVAVVINFLLSCCRFIHRTKWTFANIYKKFRFSYWKSNKEPEAVFGRIKWSWIVWCNAAWICFFKCPRHLGDLFQMVSVSSRA